MEHRICGTVICTLVLLPATFFCSAHADKMQKSVAAAENEPLSTFLPKRLGELGLVGAGVGMIRSDGSIWANGYGLASMEDKIPATADTVAMWASCSKVVTGAAALKAMESKHIGLDTPVNSWLPFEVVNPGFSDKAITFRMLLTHLL